MSVTSIMADIYSDVASQLEPIIGALTEGVPVDDTRSSSSVGKEMLDMRGAERDVIDELNTSENGLEEDTRNLAIHQRNQRLRRDVLIVRQGHKRLMQGAAMLALKRERQLEDMIENE